MIVNIKKLHHLIMKSLKATISMLLQLNCKYQFYFISISSYKIVQILSLIFLKKMLFIISFGAHKIYICAYSFSLISILEIVFVISVFSGC